MRRSVLEKGKLFWLSGAKDFELLCGGASPRNVSFLVKAREGRKPLLLRKKNKLIVKAREGKISGVVSRNGFAGNLW